MYILLTRAALFLSPIWRFGISHYVAMAIINARDAFCEIKYGSFRSSFLYVEQRYVKMQIEIFEKQGFA